MVLDNRSASNPPADATPRSRPGDPSANVSEAPPNTHADRVAALRTQWDAQPPDTPIRLAKRTSNLFRPRTRTTSPGLDVSSLTHVLDVDPVARTADVEGMVTYEQLVDATLPHGLMPLVVPQLKTITVGGAVTGLGIESSSFRNGMPHESVLEMEILTGDGEVVLARPSNEHSELFFGFPNSYGTLGYALRLLVELEPVRPYVRLRHLRHSDPRTYFAELARHCAEGDADFVDGTVFGPDELYLTLGTFTDEAPATSDYTWLDVYYTSIRERDIDYLHTRDYLWRWDTDWFWCSRALGVQHRLVRLLLGPDRLRSDNYWKIVAFDRRHGVSRRVNRLLGRPQREAVIQDIEVPVDAAADFLDFLHREVPLSPVWICPVRQRHPDRQWPLYELDPHTLYVNFGFWGTLPVLPGRGHDARNRLVEQKVTELGGRKSLYSEAFYDERTFWRLYNGPAYERLKHRYDPQGRLLDLYSKCVKAE
ncbi:FAD-binding protein [Saccharomonospora viridis]|mgnify:CR=1 FL=1|jgi:FAD/FMN-containing dehydrogenase|uniref:Delta(24)-sterol reductase n=2 Tax=Saccharomonospora viridis TaxID=1852 RepID=C7MX89_SACVD|nr:FAD-binding oxidoreductase [Saccharomonospora viridis]ACU95898.1 FAD/FMN-dependent dehydrogenase [Saccharomonospora viridis DSM 43017]KHF45608.1 FAD-linked oxidase [Saccharomonospora viridis]SFP73037.1 FAD/FMN-containing dehydrogenase [Saccharomonospora viridis]